MSLRCTVRVGLALLAVWVALGSPPPASGQLMVAGKIRTEDGKPPPVGVTVRIETPGRQSLAEQFAGSDGEFEFPSVPAAEFTLVIIAEGYREIREPLDLRFESTQKFVNITLVREDKDRRAPAEPPALTDHAAPRKARGEYKKGRKALDKGEYETAQGHLEKAVAEYPCYARAQTDLATALAAQDQAEPAEAALRKSLECDPDYHPAYALLALILNAHARYAESETILLEGLRRTPNSWQLHYQMGICQYGLNRNAKAEEHYQRALSLNPERPGDVHARLADVYLRQGAYHLAYKQLEASLVADPVGRFSEAIRKRMMEIEFSGVLRRPPTETVAPLEAAPAREEAPAEQE